MDELYKEDGNLTDKITYTTTLEIENSNIKETQANLQTEISNRYDSTEDGSMYGYTA